MNFELTGGVNVIMDVQTFDSGFSKREFVVTVEDGSYPQNIKFELLKDKTTLIDGYQQGDQIKVSFNIRGNEYNGKYYNNLVAWRVERAGAAVAAAVPPPPQMQDSAPTPPPGFGNAPDDGTDLPF